MKPLTLNNVTIGDRFGRGRNITAIVVDFHETRSLTTGEVINYSCIVKAEGLASNLFEVPFATVVRNRISAARPETPHFERGDRVTYIGQERGIVKEVNERGVFVVFNCGGDWENYGIYTAPRCNPDTLTPGWPD